MSSKLFIVLVAIFALLELEIGLAIKITINPPRFDGENSNTVKISCTPDKAESAAEEVMVMKVAKKGEKAIAVLNQNNSIVYADGAREFYEATGKITKPPANSRLDLVIKKPLMRHTGTYTCNIFYMDKEAGVKDEKTSSYLTVDDPRVRQLKDKANELMKYLAAEDKARQKLNAKETAIEEKLKGLEIKLNQLAHRNVGSTPIVGFTVTSFDLHIFPKRGQALVLPHPIMMQGQAYNMHTGVFTAPRSGLYAFHLVMETACGVCGIVVHVKANDRILFTLKVGDPVHLNQNSASTVVKLGAGDRVRTVVAAITPQVHLAFGRATIFSGYLVNVG